VAAVPTAALVARTAPAITGMASAAVQRSEGIGFPTFLVEVREVLPTGDG
jgi:hypothetical protein